MAAPSLSFDLAIVGSGFGGSMLAMIARRLGRSVLLLERERHPRFAIGESSTPLANLLWEELCARYDLPSMSSLSKWGAWQEHHPGIACGLKRGFTFYHHHLDRPWSDDARRRHQLLVGASPHDRIADTHWYRPDLDRFLVDEARKLGVEYLDEVRLEVARPSGAGWDLAGDRHGHRLEFRTRFIVDASGPRGFLFRALNLPEAPFAHLPPTAALYTHFAGVKRWEECFPSVESPPYPVDDAAVHHVFDGGWIWVLRFNNGLTSAGLAARKTFADQIGLEEGAPAWGRLLARLPSVRALFEGAGASHPFVYAPRLSFRSGCVSGATWALLPSAAGFVDPLLSTGFTLNLLGLSRLADAIGRDWDTERFAGRLATYGELTLTELEAAAGLIAALYAHLNDFEVFAALSRLYFAAVSFTETARRLGRAERAGRLFLLADHPHFSRACRECCREAMRMAGPGFQAGTGKARLLERIREAIDPVDVAGLTGVQARNWHPVRASDLFTSRHKLGASPEEIEAMLRRCGFECG
jgi:tetracycline 7-halogenase / FADH2 O2-dependent halogenase